MGRGRREEARSWGGASAILKGCSCRFRAARDGAWGTEPREITSCRFQVFAGRRGQRGWRKRQLWSGWEERKMRTTR